MTVLIHTCMYIVNHKNTSLDCFYVYKCATMYAYVARQSQTMHIMVCLLSYSGVGEGGREGMILED